MATLDELLQPGASLKIDYGPDNRATKVIHIRAIVDGEFYAFRWWKGFSGWQYDMKHRTYFEVLHERGRLIERNTP